MAAQVSIDSNNHGKLARALQQRLSSLGIEVKLGQAYEALAALSGDRNWHALKARIAAAPVQSPAAREDSSLAGALKEAAAAALSAGRITVSEADALSSAASGDDVALGMLAADCGHVIVASIDAAAEVERWHGHLGDFLEAHSGTRTPFSREDMVLAAKEYAEGADYTRRATGDFFHDWLHDRIREGELRRGPGPR